MKRNPVFSLHNIAGTVYLLPHGQGIADHRRGIRLNETGVFLWNLLEHISDCQELLCRYADYYEASFDELPQLKQDLTDFLDQLFSLGILLEDAVSAQIADRHSPMIVKPVQPARTNIRTNCFLFLKIGPLVVHLICHSNALPSEFLPFQTTEAACADLTVELKNADLSIPEKKLSVIQNPELCLYETDRQYFLQFPQMPQLTGAVLSKDGSYAAVSCRMPFTKQFSKDLFHVMRFLFLYTAQKHDCFVLHSASILYQEQAWLFSGHSGMGKSTHTNLWKELFQVPVFNGDLNMLGFENGTPVIYGLPWCGTSGIAETGSYPLGGIVLLGRGTMDACVELAMDQKILLTTQRLISPVWNASMLQHSLDFMTALAARTRICLLKCTKNPAAAETMKHWIDQPLDDSHEPSGFPAGE